MAVPIPTYRKIEAGNGTVEFRHVARALGDLGFSEAMGDLILETEPKMHLRELRAPTICIWETWLHLLGPVIEGVQILPFLLPACIKDKQLPLWFPVRVCRPARKFPPWPKPLAKPSSQTAQWRVARLVGLRCKRGAHFKRLLEPLLNIFVRLTGGQTGRGGPGADEEFFSLAVFQEDGLVARGAFNG